MWPFQPTLKLVEKIYEVLDKEEQILKGQLDCVNFLFRKSLSSEFVRLNVNKVEKTKIVVKSGEKTFVYESLDDVISKVVTKEDLLSGKTSRDGQEVVKGCGDSTLDLVVQSVKNGDHPELLYGLKKLDEYFELRKRRKEKAAESCDTFLRNIEELNQSSLNQLPHQQRTEVSYHLESFPCENSFSVSTPNRFKKTSPKTESMDVLIDLLQGILKEAVSLEMRDIKTPSPAVLQLANVLNNLERPKCLVFVKDESGGHDVVEVERKKVG